MITQIFNPLTELAIATGTQTNKVNEEIKTQSVTVEAKISKGST